MERGEQNEKRINRDYTRELQNIQTQSDKEKHLMTMALIGAKKLAEKYHTTEDLLRSRVLVGVAGAAHRAP